MYSAGKYFSHNNSYFFALLIYFLKGGGKTTPSLLPLQIPATVLTILVTDIIHSTHSSAHPITTKQEATKRCFDIVLAVVSLILAAPLFLLVILLQLITTKRPIFFRQERIGMHGKPFLIVKFRTMKEDAEENGPQLSPERESHKYTPIGSFLRKHHLDELPQLWNVLRGEMSFVGYRPERQYFIDLINQHDSRYTQLYRMRPGVTSMATITNGYTDTLDKMLRRLEMDLEYLNNHSLQKDIAILFRTIKILF